MSRLSQGERAAFDPLFRVLYPRALRLARIKLAEDRAADVAQSVMMKVFASASEFEAGKPVLAWFYAIAAVQGGDDPERLLLEQELRGCLDRAVASLDDTSAEAIACLLDDRPCPGIGASAFRKRVSRAYARLRLLLGGLDAK